ncbi:AAA family ATPase [Fusarium sp. NRRL 52700]|nr:AAA family ATPase [Fusarium sp. NRRL 52700]
MLAQSVEAKVRPLANTSLEKSSLIGASRIYISRDTFLSLTGNLESGKLCVVTPLESPTQNEGVESQEQHREALLHILPEKNLDRNVVIMTKAFREATGFKLGERVRIELAGTIPQAEAIEVLDVSQRTEENAEEFDRMERLDSQAKYPISWPSLIGFTLVEFVFPGMVVEAVHPSKARRHFKVLSVNSQTNNLAKYSLKHTNIHVHWTYPQGCGKLVVTDVPGMSKAVKSLNQFLDKFTHPINFKGYKRSSGFVIHGGRGTGKTFILNRIADTKWGKVHRIKTFDKLASIKLTFRHAQRQQPSIILIDDLHTLISKDNSNRLAIIDTIAEELDALSEISQSGDDHAQVVVVATCSDFYLDLPEELRDRTRFFLEAALPIPRLDDRLEILKFLDMPMSSDKQVLLQHLADETHAFSPRDLCKLAEKALYHLDTRLHETGTGSQEECFLKRSDLDRARSQTQPSAMHDINLNPPTIHWQDVGGQEVLKQALHRMIKYTKKPEHFLRAPPMNLLMYGPPGCSKTLLAQALATESGFNFFSVKGAELLNMYVGESERAVRALFQRARRAQPSIIFFDEIDSIGGQRSGSGSNTRSTGPANILTSLLTEMDGFEVLSGVIVVAATNRPQAMDSALLRPGRFDQTLYVGPPDGTAREAIFNVHLRGLPLASDVDIAHLSRLAEGYSGAEIKFICDRASMLAQERYDDDGTANKLEIDMGDLKAALEQTPRGITKQQIDGFEKWAEQFKH